MKTEALSKFLDVLEEQLSNEEAASEIAEIRNVLETRQCMPGHVEVLCQSLSLAFTLPASRDLMITALAVCDEALSGDSGEEQILDAVDDYLDHRCVDRVDTCLIQSFLVGRSDVMSAARWAEEAQAVATKAERRIHFSWVLRTQALFHSGRGVVLHHQHQLGAAESCFQQAVKEWPELWEAWVKVGDLRLKQNKLAGALAAYEQASKLKPQDSGPWRGIAFVYLKQRNLEKAEIAARRAVTLNPETGRSHYVLGHIQSERGEWFSAICSYRLSLSLEPEDGSSWNSLGSVLTAVGEYDEAMAAFRRSIAVNKNEEESSPAPSNLIALLLHLNRFADAGEELQRYFVAMLDKAEKAPFWVAEAFRKMAASEALTHYDIVAFTDRVENPPGCGEHIIDHYLSIVQQIFAYGLKSKKLESIDAISGLLYIGMLWCLYAEKLSQKGLSKQPARERLYAIKQDLANAIPQQAMAYGFSSAWPELEARMGTTSPEEFAHEMLRQEPEWLAKVTTAQEQGEVEDLRWRLKGNLWIHLYEYQREPEYEHMQRAHYYMELLKGHTVLHKLANPRIMATAIDPHKWNRYVSSLPVKVDQTATVDLRACTGALPENAIALSFYFLRRTLLPGRLLVIVLKPGQEPCLTMLESTKRLEKLQEVATCLKQVHHQVAVREKVPAIGRVFGELSGEKKELKGRDLVKAIVEWEKKQLRQACESLLQGVIDVDELRGKDLYISPSPEMYDIPFGLILKGDEFLNSIVRSITVVPIFSLRQFQHKRYLPNRHGLVLCLDQEWEDEAKQRTRSLSGKWCDGLPQQKTEHALCKLRGDIRQKYDGWISAIAGMHVAHVIGHHDAMQWSHSTKQEPNLGQFGRYLYDAPEKLFSDVLSLETCWGGTWSEPEDLMGLFVSFIASGASHVIASPFSVVPAGTSGQLFERIYGYPLEKGDHNIGLQIARAMRDAAEQVRLASLNSEDTIPTLWGALQLYAGA